ncbi:Hypothetical protein NTJ_16341 [Nesidiocoris tenuis]|nr:Hypothetical protein NTJ_16341 [Nesidiocoris tenuis]
MLPNKKCLIRSIGQLYPIEIEEIKEDDLDEETHEEDFTQNIKSEGPQQNYRTTRKRSATELAERRIRKIFEDEDD